jgi:hypothetical protein
MRGTAENRGFGALAAAQPRFWPVFGFFGDSLAIARQKGARAASK